MTSSRSTPRGRRIGPLRPWAAVVAAGLLSACSSAPAATVEPGASMPAATSATATPSTSVTPEPTPTATSASATATPRATPTPSRTPSRTPTPTAQPQDEDEGRLPAGIPIHAAEAEEFPWNPEAEEGWTREDDIDAAWTLDPCLVGRYSGDPTRTHAVLLHYRFPEATLVEQAVRYPSADAAGEAVADMRSALARCAREASDVEPGVESRWSATTVAIGDEAYRVAQQAYRDGSPALGGQRGILLRVGSVVWWESVSGEYASAPAATDFELVTADAKAAAAAMR